MMEKANFYELNETEVRNKIGEKELHEGIKVKFVYNQRVCV